MTSVTQFSNVSPPCHLSPLTVALLFGSPALTPSPDSASTSRPPLTCFHTLPPPHLFYPGGGTEQPVTKLWSGIEEVKVSLWALLL